MSFGVPITIAKAVSKIHSRQYLLPAIQREFVWRTGQIEKLFDSLMLDYPISSFLFWKVDNANKLNYQFYEFVRDYHERDNKHNVPADIKGDSSVTAILDGQQRLTSLYLGLKGSYAYKQPWKRWDNDEAFPRRLLCLNLLKTSEEIDRTFEFAFLSEDKYKENDENHHWFIVGEILNMTKLQHVNSYLTKNNITIMDDEKADFATDTLVKLFQVVHKENTINYFLEEDESLDKVLNIFIRVNSGGTQLSYSDLLLSIATAQWQEKDARQEITSFVDEINKVGDGFDFNKDLVLKSCLVVSGVKDIAFKVDNFNYDNMLLIESKWEKISKAVKATAHLLSSFGYNRDTLTSNNAIIPIALYLYNLDIPSNFAESIRYKDDRNAIFKWLVIVLLKRLFGGQPDGLLRPIREIINNSSNGFPYNNIYNKFKGDSRSLVFGDDEIDNLYHYKYAQSYTFSALALMYPTLDFRNKFHQDHIFPKSLFTEKRLKNYGIPDDNIQFYMDNYNCLANLQLLEGVPNQEKSNQDFKNWIEITYPNLDDKKDYMRKHYIPDVDLSLTNFMNFIDARKTLLRKAYKKLLS